MSYSGLMRHLPADRPIYGLQARGIAQPEMAPQTLEDMAADYVQTIRQIQPTGPYNLLGWSFGGLVAHAIATRLQVQGERVALLALLDSYPAEANGDSQNSDLDDETILANQLKALGYYQGDEPLQVSSALDILRKDGDMLSNLEEHQVTAVIQVLKQNVRLASNFVPHAFRRRRPAFCSHAGRDSAPGQLGPLCQRQNRDTRSRLRTRAHDAARTADRNWTHACTRIGQDGPKVQAKRQSRGGTGYQELTANPYRMPTD